MTRIILYTGKGGVGKSSIAAATAVRVAEQGRRTLLVSSDLAHNLSDLFECDIGRERVRLTETLTALEIDVLHEVRENWQVGQEFVAGILTYLGIENVVAEEVALIPGLGELFLLARVLKEYREWQLRSLCSGLCTDGRNSATVDPDRHGMQQATAD